MIKDFIANNNKENPNKEFIYFESKGITIQNFNLDVKKISNYIAQNFEGNKYIGIQIENPILFFKTLIAINRLDAIPIIYPTYNSMTDYIDVTNIAISIDDQIAKEALNKNVIAREPNNKLYVPDKTQVVLFTSGTTGKPKAVELSYRSIYNNALKWNNILNFSENDLCINCLPLHHIGGLMIFFRTIIFNMKMEVTQFKKIKYPLKLNSIISLVPTMLKQIIIKNKIDLLKNLKVAIIGGDNLDSKIKKKCLESNMPLYISYGMTETSSGIAGYWLDKDSVDKHNYIPHKNVSINVDKSLITIDADCLFSKYFQNKDNQGCFVTNDMGASNNDNSFSVRGRKNMFIISGGENIDLSMIEEKIIKIKNINHCLAIGAPDDKWGQKLIVYIVENKSNERYNKSYYLSMLAREVPKFMLPKEINIVKNLNNIKYDSNY